MATPEYQIKNGGECMNKFKVNGWLFQVKPNGQVQVFTHDFDNVVGLAGLGGFWKTVGTVAAAGAAAYAGYSIYNAPGSSIGEKITGAVSQIGTDIQSIMPSGDTVAKAIGIASSIAATQYGIKTSQQLPQLPYDQQYQAQQTAQPGVIPPGYKVGMDTTTMMLLGGGALVVLMMLTRKR